MGFWDLDAEFVKKLLDLFDLESWNNAVVHFVVKKGSANEVLTFLKQLLDFDQALIWRLLQLFNFVLELLLLVLLDHKVVQFFQNPLTSVDRTKDIKYLASNGEHELAPN